MRTLGILVAIALTTTDAQSQTIPVNADNFAQAETAWNFNRWAKLGCDEKIVHLRNVAPTGPKAPTVRMNWDTLYSVRIVRVPDTKTFSIHLPKSELYMAAHVIDEDGFAPYYLIEKGKTHQVQVNTDYALIIFRTEIIDRKSDESLVRTHDSQDKIRVTGISDERYQTPEFDQQQLEELRSEYKQEFLSKGVNFTYAKGPGRQDQHLLNLSHAAGWGGMEPELNVSNAYFSSDAMSGDVARSITFDDPKNKFFTSFTLYDANGYLMDGETHINSKMWIPNDDGTITIHFNAGDDAINNLSSHGQPFNYTVRNYGVSQLVLDGSWRPLEPQPCQ
ncbi:DUF1254 domain-containing protein [Crateriforma conspicua]|nr:hypothetical protein [Crateriforma conspicua]